MPQDRPVQSASRLNAGGDFGRRTSLPSIAESALRVTARRLGGGVVLHAERPLAAVLVERHAQRLAHIEGVVAAEANLTDTGSNGRAEEGVAANPMDVESSGEAGGGGLTEDELLG